ncbi:conserved hypothetical protein [Cupriavidus taiwanensis]|nr:conserved hypothetical protein [Cupriavidus taiwanensis]
MKEETMAKAENLVTSIRVEIDAPVALVWEVLTDFARYGEWNTFCPGLETTGRLGDMVHMQVRIPGTDQVIPVNEYLVAWEPERLLSWEQRPTDENKDAARRDQYLEALGPGRTRYFTTDLFLGLNAETIMREHGAWVKQGFDQVARDVKARAEALQAQRQASRN